MGIEKSITINNTDVRLRYCTAVETGFEHLTKKSSDVFIPKVTKDAEGNVTSVDKPDATFSDYISLAVAAMVAAYDRNNENPPIDSHYILFDATSEEVRLLISTVTQLRNEWYTVPSVIKKEEPTAEDMKNKPDSKNA